MEDAACFLLNMSSMSVSLEDYTTRDKGLPMRDVVAGLQQTLQRNHLKILEAARRDWEQKHMGIDPSDSCASIHIAKMTRRTKKPARKSPGKNRWSPA